MRTWKDRGVTVFCFVAFLSALLGCTDSRHPIAAPTKIASQQEDEAAMLMAMHHNRDEVFAHMGTLGDLSWQKTPSGTLNWDCSLAIIEKHNQKYPKTPWELEGKDLRDKVLGPPEGERLILARACAERSLVSAEETIRKSADFEKR